MADIIPINAKMAPTSSGFTQRVIKALVTVVHMDVKEEITKPMMKMDCPLKMVGSVHPVKKSQFLKEILKELEEILSKICVNFLPIAPVIQAKIRVIAS